MERTKPINLSDIKRVIVQAADAGYPPLLYINGQYYDICIDLTEKEYDELTK